MKHFLSIILWALVLTSCENDFDLVTEENPPLVVEAWIADGESPIVMVTHAVALDTDSADFSGFIEKWGRVSIFDGDRRYLLTGRINKGYLPSLIFTNTHLQGKPGHSYRLLVETEQGNAESCAELMANRSHIELSIEQPEDSLYAIRAFAENLEADACYKFYIKVIGKEEHFYPAFKATFLGRDFPSDGLVITKMQRIQLDSDAENEFSHYFAPGEVVQVRLCRIPNTLYDFWRNYDSTVALGSNMLLTFTDNCPGNVVGAYGYWQTEGTVTKVVRIPK